MKSKKISRVLKPVLEVENATELLIAPDGSLWLRGKRLGPFEVSIKTAVEWYKEALEKNEVRFGETGAFFDVIAKALLEVA